MNIKDFENIKNVYDDGDHFKRSGAQVGKYILVLLVVSFEKANSFPGVPLGDLHTVAMQKVNVRTVIELSKVIEL